MNVSFNLSLCACVWYVILFSKSIRQSQSAQVQLNSCTTYSTNRPLTHPVPLPGFPLSSIAPPSKTKKRKKTPMRAEITVCEAALWKNSSPPCRCLYLSSLSFLLCRMGSGRVYFEQTPELICIKSSRD